MLLRERDEARTELTCTLSQVKKIYLALFRQLHAADLADFDALDEDDMLLTLQSFLQARARAEGVDVTNHSEWDAWLGVTNAPSCAQRFASRRPEL